MHRVAAGVDACDAGSLTALWTLKRIASFRRWYWGVEVEESSEFSGVLGGTITVDSGPVDRLEALVRSNGAEIGLRGRWARRSPCGSALRLIASPAGRRFARNPAKLD